MSRLIAFLARQMMPWAMRVSDNSYMQALRDAFAMLLPFVLVASFFGVAAWVFLDPWGTVLGLLLIPYILAPLVNTVVSWLALTAGLVPLFKYVVPWTMPAFFGGLLGTGSLAGGILQLFLLVLDIFIYAPFVMAAGRIKTDTDK